MNKKVKYFINLLLLILYIAPIIQCTKEERDDVKRSKEASIISFELGTYTGKLNGTSLLIEVPYTADISSLAAKVKLSESATIKPDPTKVKDWSAPVFFTVTAENGKDSNRYKVEVKILPAVLTFEKLTKEYTKGGYLNATEILKHVKGKKDGYTLKEITDLFPNDIVRVNGTAPNLRLEFEQIGVFRALLRLKHNATSDLDVTISNAAFEITKEDAPSDLRWNKQSKTYHFGGEISNAEILAGLNGTKKGYRVKTVTITNSGGTRASVSGMGTSAKIVAYTNLGTLTLSIVFEHDTKEDKTITGAEFEITKASAPSLNWIKQRKVFSSGGEITNADLLAGVTGIGKVGYTIKIVTITNYGGMTSARVSGSGTATKITSYTKIGTFTLTLVLAHPTKEDVTLRNAQFEIIRGSAPVLNWTNQRKAFSSGGEITSANLLAGVTGSGKAGYTIKTVTIVDYGGMTSARVSGSGSAVRITGYRKAGTLTFNLVLAHPTKDDVTLRNAQFQITKAGAPRLAWTNQRKVFSNGGQITNGDLLAGVTGSGKAGYTIKTVDITDDGGVNNARVSGSGRAVRITSYRKAGTLTLTLVLGHDAKDDVTLTNAQFEIAKAGAPRLSWTNQRKRFSSSGEITNADLLAGVTGSDRAGYTIKTVRITSDGSTNARVSGSGRASRITNYNRIGTLTLTLVLEHDAKDDITLTGAQFQIIKGTAPSLSWIRQSKPFSRGGEITNADLLAGITSSDRAGYTIKTVTITNYGGISARVSGSGTAARAARITGYTTVGTLTLTLVLEHDTKDDVTLTGAQFQIIKGTVSGLSWTRQSKPFSVGGEITNGDLLAGVTGSARVGYTIKTVRITNYGGMTRARVSGNGAAARITSYTKAGTLTLTLVLEHDTKNDVTLTGAQFEITKIAAPRLSWTGRTKPFSRGGEITNSELLAVVTGSGKTGYTIKTVTMVNARTTGARVSGNGTAARITGYNKAGNLTLTFVLEHPYKLDVTVAGTRFDITKTSAESLSWTRRSKPFSSGGEITNGDLLAGVTGSGRAGYTIRTVNITNDGGMTSATVSGSGTAARITGYTRVGTLTLTLVLEHDTKRDATITNARFEITKASAPRLSWTRQIKTFTPGGEITNGDLLAGVTGSEKRGYTIKTVAITNYGGIAAIVSGSGSNAKITSYRKSGVLTLTLVLEHDTKSDVTLTGAQFEITKGTPPRLSWTRQSKPFSVGGEITNGDLLAGVTGSEKGGYTIKTVRITGYGGLTNARVSGNGTAAQITSYTKAGTLTLTIVLEHGAKNDVTLTGAQFEITKIAAPRLSWTRRSKPFSSGGEITNSDLLAGVTGSGRAGYTIKTVNITGHGGLTRATVSGSGTSAKIMSYTKAGTLTLTLVLEHPYRVDATISSAQFDITKISAETLSYTKQIKAYTHDGGEITNAQLLAGVTGSGKTDYTIKTVTITNHGGMTRATVSGSGTSAKIMSYTKAGTLTFTLVLEHPYKLDATISNAQYEIYRMLDITSSGIVTLKVGLDKSVARKLNIPRTLDGITVTSIGNQAFYRCLFTDITLPNTLTSIGQEAFAYSRFTSITSITIPNSVTSIGNQAFYQCRSLTSVTIGNSVRTIGNGAFFQCNSLTSITIPNSVTSIGYATFKFCTSLTSVTMGNSVRSIGDEAFMDCRKLTSITIPNTVTSIGRMAFKLCRLLTSVTLPNRLTSIAESTFESCNSLTNITLPNSLVSIGKKAFKYNYKLTSITIPNTVTSIGESAFDGCSRLTSVTIGNSVTSIGQDAFSGCSRLTSITIPNSVTSIGKKVFESCTSLTSIAIPNSVTSIGDWAFSRCTSLTSITIPNSVTSIGQSAFNDCSRLTSVTIGNSVTSIGQDAFSGCSRLTSITIPNSVTSIGRTAFSRCSSLTTVTMDNAATSIGRSAFYACTSLTTVTLSRSLTSIGENAFGYCTKLTSITIPSSVTTIGTSPFDGCNNLTTIRVPNAKMSAWSANLRKSNSARVVGY